MCKLSPSFSTLHKFGISSVFLLIFGLLGFKLQIHKLPMTFYLWLLPDTLSSSLSIECISSSSPPSLPGLSPQHLCPDGYKTTCYWLQEMEIDYCYHKQKKFIKNILGTLHIHRKAVHTFSENVSGDAAKDTPQNYLVRNSPWPSPPLYFSVLSLLGLQMWLNIWSSLTFKNPRNIPSDSS